MTTEVEEAWDPGHQAGGTSNIGVLGCRVELPLLAAAAAAAAAAHKLWFSQIFGTVKLTVPFVELDPDHLFARAGAQTHSTVSSDNFQRKPE